METGRLDRATAVPLRLSLPWMRKHTIGHSGPATRGRGLWPATAGALAGSGAGGQPPPLGVGAPAGSLPRAARASPSGVPLASVDLWPCATRFHALHMGEVVYAIPDLRAVGSAPLRPRQRAAGSLGRAGQGAHSTVVHGSAMAHAAEAMPPRRPSTTKLAHERSQRYACLRSGRRTGQCSHAHTDAARLDCPRLGLGCQARLGHGASRPIPR